MNGAMSKPAEMIFDYLLRSKSNTIPQLSRALHLTRADIRHHLNELILEGRVQKSIEASSQVGRPAHTYLAVRPLSRTWVQTLVDTQNQILLKRGLSEQEITSSCAEMILADFTPTGHPTTKLNQAVTYLHTKGIEANWIAGPDGPIISLSETEFLDRNLANAIIEKIQKEL